MVETALTACYPISSSLISQLTSYHREIFAVFNPSYLTTFFGERWFCTWFRMFMWDFIIGWKFEFSAQSVTYSWTLIAFSLVKSKINKKMICLFNTHIYRLLTVSTYKNARLVWGDVKTLLYFKTLRRCDSFILTFIYIASFFFFFTWSNCFLLFFLFLWWPSYFKYRRFLVIVSPYSKGIIPSRQWFVCAPLNPLQMKAKTGFWTMLLNEWQCFSPDTCGLVW